MDSQGSLSGTQQVTQPPFVKTEVDDERSELVVACESARTKRLVAPLDDEVDNVPVRFANCPFSGTEPGVFSCGMPLLLWNRLWKEELRDVNWRPAGYGLGAPFRSMIVDSVEVSAEIRSSGIAEGQRDRRSGLLNQVSQSPFLADILSVVDVTRPSNTWHEINTEDNDDDSNDMQSDDSNPEGETGNILGPPHNSAEGHVAPNSVVVGRRRGMHRRLLKLLMCDFTEVFVAVEYKPMSLAPLLLELEAKRRCHGHPKIRSHGDSVSSPDESLSGLDTIFVPILNPPFETDKKPLKPRFHKESHEPRRAGGNLVALEPPQPCDPPEASESRSLANSTREIPDGSSTSHFPIDRFLIPLARVAIIGAPKVSGGVVLLEDNNVVLLASLDCSLLPDRSLHMVKNTAIEGARDEPRSPEGKVPAVSDEHSFRAVPVLPPADGNTDENDCAFDDLLNAEFIST